MRTTTSTDYFQFKGNGFCQKDIFFFFYLLLLQEIVVLKQQKLFALERNVSKEF